MDIILFNNQVDSPIFIFLVIVWALTSIVASLDRANVKAKKAGTKPPIPINLPSWVGLIYWVNLGLMGLLVLWNWKAAVVLFIIGFIFWILPVWETIGKYIVKPQKK